MKCQLCKPRIFTPPGTAATRDARICTRPDGGRPGPGRNNKERRGYGQRSRRRTTTTTRPGLQHEGPRRAEPAEQRQSSGEKGQPRATQREAEDEHNPQVANDTGGEEPIQACAPYGEASDHIGSHTSSNAHPDCAEATIIKTHDVTVLNGEPACHTQRERRREIGQLQNAGALPDEGCRCLANQR